MGSRKFHRTKGENQGGGQMMRMIWKKHKMHMQHRHTYIKKTVEVEESQTEEGMIGFGKSDHGSEHAHGELRYSFDSTGRRSVWEESVESTRGRDIHEGVFASDLRREGSEFHVADIRLVR